VRRLPTILALVGCIVHAMVLPWYAASRFPAHWSAAAQASDLAADLAVICHGGVATTTDGATQPVPGQPNPNSDCPICKGLAGVQLAILVAAQAGLLERDAVPVQLRPADTAAIKHIVFVPRSRGPPFSV
jgi:Protein of unknown function (DUF2946)